MVRDFKSSLAEWLINSFPTVDDTLKHIESIGGKISKKTLYNWKNKA